MSTDGDLSPYKASGKLFGFVCVVIGADNAIGQSVIHELAVHGAACIYACSQSSKRTLTNGVAEDFPNCKVLPYVLHTLDEQATLGLIDEVLNDFGRLDVWVTSAGLTGPSSVADTGPSDLRRCLENNALAPFFALKYAPPAMAKTSLKGSYPNAAPKPQKYGSIIVVSAVAGPNEGNLGPSFVMSSHAALGVVKSGVASLKGTGVRINCISNGQVHPDADLKKISLPLPEDVARVAGFLASGFSKGLMGSEIVVNEFVEA